MPNKISLVSAFPPSMGTLNEYGYHLAMELAARDDVNEVIVVADLLPDGVVEPHHHPKIRVIRCWKFNSVATPLKILSALRTERCAGVIYNVQTASFGDREVPAAVGFITPMMSRLMGVKSGVLTHNLIEGIDLENTILNGNPLRQAIVKLGGWMVSFAMTRANYVTTTLDLYVDILKNRFPTADVSMVPHGTFARDAIVLLPFEERRKRMVTMGKFGTYKKLDTLLQVFDDLSKTDQELELVVGGTDHPNTPGYMAGLEKKYAKNSQIQFAGYIAEEDVAAFFASARLAIFDYTATTGSSGVMHQCASYGAVPVFPKIGDFIELVEREGLQGVYYGVADSHSMQQAIEAALNDEVGSGLIANSNLNAVDDFPLSSVVDFHVNKLVPLTAPARQTGNPEKAIVT